MSVHAHFLNRICGHALGLGVESRLSRLAYITVEHIGGVFLCQIALERSRLILGRFSTFERCTPHLLTPDEFSRPV